MYSGNGAEYGGTIPLLQMKLRFFSQLLGIAACAVPLVLSAGITISDVAPVDGVLLGSAGLGDSNLGFSNTPTEGNQFGGIAFRLEEAVKLEAVTFFLNTVSSGMPKAQVRVSVVRFDDDLPESQDTSEVESYTYKVVHAETKVFPNARPVQSYLTFSFADAPSLDAGVYGILLEIADPAPGRAITLRNADANLPHVVNFRTVVSGDSTTYQVTKQEVYFALQGSVRKK